MPSSAMTHLNRLSLDLGPRGSTTPQEREAAVYARRRSETLGMEREALPQPSAICHPLSAICHPLPNLREHLNNPRRVQHAVEE